MSRTLAGTLALVGFAASASAADLSVDSLKDPLPDTLSWYGVTIYGTVDVGYGYQTHGAPGNGEFRQGNDYNIYSSKFANRPISALESQAMEQSKIGVEVEEAIGGGWLAIGKFDTSFNPLYGTLANGPQSLLDNAGTALAKQTANGDSGRAGQAFNGVAYAGVSNASYGTLTFGRQTSLQGDAFASYDPQGQSNAFSLLGWSSSLAGAGITEAATMDNSVKYVYKYGPLHAAGQYAQGGDDTGFFGSAYGANVGGSYQGFSLDAVYERVNAAVQLTANAATPANINTGSTNFSTTTLSGQITDSDSWSVQGKYTLDFGGDKDDPAAGSKLTLFAGFEDIQYFNSSQTRDQEYIGRTAAGGYLLGTPLNGKYYYYASTRELQSEWAGAKYELPSGWTFTGAYYHVDQPAFSSSSIQSNPQVGSPNQQKAYTAGSFDDASFVAGYRFNKHFDVYAGVNYSAIDGGLASGYLANDDTSVVTGARLKF
jgi:predicted porin